MANGFIGGSAVALGIAMCAIAFTENDPAVRAQILQIAAVRAIIIAMMIVAGIATSCCMASMWMRDGKCRIDLDGRRLIAYADDNKQFAIVSTVNIRSFSFGGYRENGLRYLYIMANLSFNPIDRHINGYLDWMDSNFLWHALNHYQIPILVVKRQTVFDELYVKYLSFRLSHSWSQMLRRSNVGRAFNTAAPDSPKHDICP